MRRALVPVLLLLALAIAPSASAQDLEIPHRYSAEPLGLGGWSMSGGLRAVGPMPHVGVSLTVGVADIVDIDLSFDTAFVMHLGALRARVAVLDLPEIAIGVTAGFEIVGISVEGLFTDYETGMSMAFTPGLAVTIPLGTVRITPLVEFPVFFYSSGDGYESTRLVASLIRPALAIELGMGPHVTGNFRGEAWVFLDEDNGEVDAAFPGLSTGVSW